MFTITQATTTAMPVAWTEWVSQFRRHCQAFVDLFCLFCTWFLVAWMKKKKRQTHKPFWTNFNSKQMNKLNFISFRLGCWMPSLICNVRARSSCSERDWVKNEPEMCGKDTSKCVEGIGLVCRLVHSSFSVNVAPKPNNDRQKQHKQRNQTNNNKKKPSYTLN